MRRIVAIFLIGYVLALTSGALARVHDAAHAMADQLATASASHDDPAPPVHDHDESNCFLHAQLKLPMAPAGYVPLLVSLGLLVAFLTELPQSVERPRVAHRIDCRGPPAC